MLLKFAKFYVKGTNNKFYLQEVSKQNKNEKKKPSYYTHRQTTSV